MEPCKIWNEVDGLSFHENTIILEVLGRSQGLSLTRTTGSRRHARGGGDNDELEWVTHLLDDFALVAAGAGGASNVAASCLEWGQIPGNLVIRVAKNEDFTVKQMQCLKQIITIMNQVKERSKISNEN